MSCSSSNTNNIVMAVLVILLFVVILMVVRSYKQNRAPADNYFEAGKVDADAQVVTKTRQDGYDAKIEANNKKNMEKQLADQIQLNGENGRYGLENGIGEM